ncbi:Neprilysin-21 [Aphelenchoides fujianensis]|nr:Neprilysin-21 [Aphelenchoides fujianensis]
MAVDPAAVHNERRVCTSQECVKIAAQFAANMNPRAAPCEDFYAFACGNYAMHHELPADQLQRHTILDAQAVLHKQLRRLLEMPSSDAEKPWERQLRSFYAKCIDEDSLPRTGIAALNGVLAEFGGWPLARDEARWAEFDGKTEEFLAKIVNKTAVSSLIFELSIGFDLANSSRTIVEFDQPATFGFGHRLAQSADDSNSSAYFELIAAVADRLSPNGTANRTEIGELVDFERKLAAAATDETMRAGADPQRFNNRFQLWELSGAFPKLDLEAFVRKIFEEMTSVSPNDTIVVRELEYFKQLQDLLASTPKRTIANYALWRVVQSFSLFLPADDRAPFYRFQANQSQIPALLPPQRWEDCVSLSVALFDMPVGRLFVDHFLDEKFALSKVAEVMQYVKLAFVRQLADAADWMDERTRERAVRKLNAIRVHSAFPPALFNDEWLEAQWPNTIARRDEDLLSFTIRLKRQHLGREFHRWKRPVDAQRWVQSPAQISAFYTQNRNEITFPAGLLQFPFMAGGLPNFVIFALFGSIAAHESAHAFCLEGSRFDEAGNLNDWWEAASARRYRDRAECFVRQYETQTMAGDTRSNGRRSLAENIADNAGIRVAFNAYRAWSEDIGVEAALPGFQNLTSDQMFFVAYAQNFCSMVNPRFAHQLSAQPHAPAALRAVVPLQNTPAFAKAFGCASGSPMSPARRCELF